MLLKSKKNIEKKKKRSLKIMENIYWTHLPNNNEIKNKNIAFRFVSILNFMAKTIKTKLPFSQVKYIISNAHFESVYLNS